MNNNGLTSTGPTEDIIWLRQGYVGIANDNFGALTLGKQWSVTYDITGVTDVLMFLAQKPQCLYFRYRWWLLRLRQNRAGY